MYKASKAEEVFAYIKNQILSGEWKEGERLNDALLAEDIGVSRSSVREALFRLVETGVISKEYWKGYFIREITDQIVSEVVQVRIALESCAIRNFVVEASQEYIEELQCIIDASKVCLEKQQHVEYMLTDYSFHEFIYQKQSNQFIVSTMDNLQLIIHSIRRKSMGDDEVFVESAKNSIAWHQKMLDAIKTGNPDYAAEMLEGHLKVHHSEAIHNGKADKTVR